MSPMLRRQSEYSMHNMNRALQLPASAQPPDQLKNLPRPEFLCSLVHRRFIFNTRYLHQVVCSNLSAPVALRELLFTSVALYSQLKASV